MEKALVLSSGGIDSTTCVSVAVEKYHPENVITVSVFYGQKHRKELECAKKVADFYGVQHIELDLSNILAYSDCPLLQKSTKAIEHKSYAEQIAENGEGMVKTYVPYRNGLLLSAVASIAMSLVEDSNERIHIYLGNHADDAAGDAYADCSPGFIKAISEAIQIGTYGKVQVESPFCNFTKKDIVALGLKLHTPYELTWSCYEGGNRPCGTCGTCIDRAAAFAANGVKDPALEV